MANGALPSAGTQDTRVDRMEEGLPGVATVQNPNAQPPTRASFDDGAAAGTINPHPTGVIDTTETDRLDYTANVKRGQPAAW